MRMTSLSARAHPPTWHRLLIALFGVGAILVCLLALHGAVGNGNGGSGSVAPSPVAPQFIQQAAAPAVDRDVSLSGGEECSLACAPAHEMIAMACMLVLLITGVLLAAHLLLTHWKIYPHILGSLAVRVATLAPPAPPSLHLLSISRT
jgi:hypothetical protein